VKNPNPDAAKHKEIPVWNAENWLFEDFEVGKRATLHSPHYLRGGEHGVQRPGSRHAPLRSR
jgi:hypothetical protein